mmetsp:Transcript_8754/g.11858  ORF Transcript_8754/g.11858 Transcript_8754/m.11858 type:complete len:475 (+) Transcript_8754:190-1614(+)
MEYEYNKQCLHAASVIQRHWRVSRARQSKRARRLWCSARLKICLCQYVKRNRSRVKMLLYLQRWNNLLLTRAFLSLREAVQWIQEIRFLGNKVIRQLLFRSKSKALEAWRDHCGRRKNLQAQSHSAIHRMFYQTQARALAAWKSNLEFKKAAIEKARRVFLLVEGQKGARYFQRWMKFVNDKCWLKKMRAELAGETLPASLVRMMELRLRCPCRCKQEKPDQNTSIGTLSPELKKCAFCELDATAQKVLIPMIIAREAKREEQTSQEAQQVQYASVYKTARLTGYGRKNRRLPSRALRDAVSTRVAAMREAAKMKTRGRNITNATTKIATTSRGSVGEDKEHVSSEKEEELKFSKHQDANDDLSAEARLDPDVSEARSSTALMLVEEVESRKRLIIKKSLFLNKLNLDVHKTPPPLPSTTRRPGIKPSPRTTKIAKQFAIDNKSKLSQGTFMMELLHNCHKARIRNIVIDRQSP